jgi:hypothetical protein
MNIGSPGGHVKYQHACATRLLLDERSVDVWRLIAWSARPPPFHVLNGDGPFARTLPPRCHPATHLEPVACATTSAFLQPVCERSQSLHCALSFVCAVQGAVLTMATDNAVDPLAPLHYEYNHLFSPPNILGQDDSGANYEKAMLARVRTTLLDLAKTAPPDAQPIYRAASAAITLMESIRNSHKNIQETQLQAAFEALAFTDGSGSVVLEVKTQNAGMIFTRGEEAYW